MKRKVLWTVSMIMAAVLLAACGAPAAQSSSVVSSAPAQSVADTGVITPEQAKARMDKDGVTVVDVRTQQEYDEGHIADAMLLPNETLRENAEASLPDKNAELLVYCRSGRRSAEAVKTLRELGYTNVYDFGGINDWPYEVVTGNDSQSANADATAADKNGVFGTFTTKDLNGNEVTQELFAKNKLTVVNLWGTFCGPCVREMPSLGELNREYADKGVQIVGIVVDAWQGNGKVSDSVLKNAQGIIDKTGADYTHLVPNQELADAKLSQVYAIPETVLVDANGNQVGKAHMGAASKEDWKKIIDAALEKA